MLTAIPSTWCTRGDPDFAQYEWVACIADGRVTKIYQLLSPHHGLAFRETQPQLYNHCSTEPEDVTGLELRHVRIVTTSGDLKETQLNPNREYIHPVWLLGLTKELQFDPGEWRWTSNEGEVPFFNYTAKIGYQAGMRGKSNESRLHEKCRQLNLLDNEIQAAINLIWDENKPAKLQFFAWQVASGGLYTGSRAKYLGFIGECVRCKSGLLETTEHCLSFCSFSRRAWKWTRCIRKAFSLYEDASWRELALGIKPGNMRVNKGHQQRESPIAAWDVFRTALLWRIWYARCKVVFKSDPHTIIQTCHLAWSDTIHAGMARLRHLKTTYLLRNESGRLSVRQDFEKTWCRSKVFYDGSFSSPLWRLTPALTPGLPSSTET
jgi:hypothetical protein